MESFDPVVETLRGGEETLLGAAEPRAGARRREEAMDDDEVGCRRLTFQTGWLNRW